MRQTMGLRSFAPMVVACPGCGRTTSTTFQTLAAKIQSWLCEQMPVWRSQYPGVESMTVAVMGCVVNGPGESKQANIGISLRVGREPGRAGLRRRGQDSHFEGAGHRRRVPADRGRLRASTLWRLFAAAGGATRGDDTERRLIAAAHPARLITIAA
jgi:hypothetical protein